MSWGGVKGKVRVSLGEVSLESHSLRCAESQSDLTLSYVLLGRSPSMAFYCNLSNVNTCLVSPLWLYFAVHHTLNAGMQIKWQTGYQHVVLFIHTSNNQQYRSDGSWRDRRIILRLMTRRTSCFIITQVVGCSWASDVFICILHRGSSPCMKTRRRCRHASPKLLLCEFSGWGYRLRRSVTGQRYGSPLGTEIDIGSLCSLSTPRTEGGDPFVGVVFVTSHWLDNVPGV